MAGKSKQPVLVDEEDLKAEQAMERDRTGEALRDGYTVMESSASSPFPGPGGFIGRPMFMPRFDPYD